MYQSTAGSRRARNSWKGKCRRTSSWGCRKYLQHSFISIYEEALLEDQIRSGVVLIAWLLFCKHGSKREEMFMNRRFGAFLCAGAMAVTMLTGCGGGGSNKKTVLQVLRKMILL